MSEWRESHKMWSLSGKVQRVAQLSINTNYNKSPELTQTDSFLLSSFVHISKFLSPKWVINISEIFCCFILSISGWMRLCDAGQLWWVSLCRDANIMVDINIVCSDTGMIATAPAPPLIPETWECHAIVSSSSGSGHETLLSGDKSNYSVSRGDIIRVGWVETLSERCEVTHTNTHSLQ